MSKHGLSVEQVWMWPPTQLHFAVTSDSARWDNVRLMGQKQDKYLLFCSGCLPSKSLHYVTSLLICGEKKTCHQWWTGFCTDVDGEKGMISDIYITISYNILISFVQSWISCFLLVWPSSTPYLTEVVPFHTLSTNIQDFSKRCHSRWWWIVTFSEEFHTDKEEIAYHDSGFLCNLPLHSRANCLVRYSARVSAYILSLPAGAE